MTTAGIKVEEIRKRVTTTNRPKAGSVIVIAGAYKIVRSVGGGLQMKVYFEDGAWYYLTTLIHLGAYYL
jgi:hypothetical protein